MKDDELTTTELLGIKLRFIIGIFLCNIQPHRSAF